MGDEMQEDAFSADEIARLDLLVREQRAEGNLFDMLKTMESSLVLRKEMLGLEAGEVQHLGELLVREYNAVAMQCLRIDMFEDVHELLKKAYVMTEEDTFFQAEHTRLRLRAISHNNLGCLHKQRGKLTIALRHLEKAVQIEMRTPEPDNPAGTHLNICAIYSLQGEHRRALHHAKTGLEILEKHDAAQQPSGSTTQARAEPPHELYADWGAIEEIWGSAEGQPRLVREVLTQSVFAQLQSRRTSLGVTLDKCIEPDLTNPSSAAAGADGRSTESGVIAGDGECYSVFGLLFDPIVEQLHFGFPKLANHISDCNASAVRRLDLDAEFVQSVSVRVGRNICGVPYAPSINTTERKELDEQLTVMFGEMPEGLEGACLPMSAAAAMEVPLQEHGLAEMVKAPESPLLVQCTREWPEDRSVFHSESAGIWASINGVDHLTVCAADNSGDLVEVFAKVVDVLDCVEAQLADQGQQFDHSAHFGYLTTQPELVGSAMKAQIILKLPNLSQHADLADISWSLALRSSEHSAGCVAVSNLETIGKTEADLLSQLLSGAASLIRMEKELSENADEPLKKPRAVPLGLHQLPSESDSATMLPVAYHNLGAEYEHLLQFDEAVLAFAKAVKICNTRLGTQSDVTHAMQASLAGAKRARKKYRQNPQGFQVATARSHRPVVPLSSRSSGSKKPKRKHRRVKTARQHSDQRSRDFEMGGAYERHGGHGGVEHDPQWSRELMPEQEQLSLPPLCWPQNDETALQHRRKEWERLPWDHVAIDNANSLGPKENHYGGGYVGGGSFQSPPPAPPLQTATFKPAPPPRLPAGTLYRPARRPGKKNEDPNAPPPPPPPQ